MRLLASSKMNGVQGRPLLMSLPTSWTTSCPMQRQAYAYIAVKWQKPVLQTP